jgi:glycosyltransferase involved in cell wall biosynthesis
VTYHNHQLGRYLREARGLTPHKTTYLEQGVDTSLFNPKRPELAGAAEEAERDGKLVVNLCHFDAAADLEELLWSISLAVDEEPGIRSAIVGGGPLLREFRARVGNSPLKGCVSLPGPLPQDEVVKLVAAANTCTVFYKDRRANRYRSSLKLREYLAMGKKVVCTDSGELSSFSPYTYQTPPDVAEFADELVRVVGLPRSRRAIRGLRHVRSRCSWESIARRFVDRVESL